MAPKDYRTWAATLGAAWLFCAETRPDSQRECKRCIKRVVEAVAQQLGHAPTVCRASYIHPRVIDDFVADKLGLLARQLKHRAALTRAEPCEAIAVETLRAIEPVVAQYLQSGKARRRA